MIVTTSNDETPMLVAQAKSLAKDLDACYMKRHKKTIKHLLKDYGPQVFVVNSHRGLSLYHESEKEIFFHPNMAFLRIKQLADGMNDSLVSACRLGPGMSFFDGTLGLASDALVASYAVGSEGRVIGTEVSRPVYFLTAFGLTYYKEQHPQWADLIGRIEIKNISNLEALKQMPDKSMDVVYFDFMFEKTLTASTGIQVIHRITADDVLTPEHVQEACRVARCRVVAKSGYSGTSLKEFGFEVLKEHKRRNFYYGVLEIKGAAGPERLAELD